MGDRIFINYHSREVFGPILPILEVEDIDEAIELVGCGYASISVLWQHDELNMVSFRPSPLVLYLFTENDKILQKGRHSILPNAIRLV